MQKAWTADFRDFDGWKNKTNKQTNKKKKKQKKQKKKQKKTSERIKNPSSIKPVSETSKKKLRNININNE